MDRAVRTALAALWLGNIVDTAATLYFVRCLGMVEMNPIAASFLNSPALFVTVKVLVISAACVLFWACRRLKIARLCAYVGGGVYTALAVYHFILAVISG